MATDLQGAIRLAKALKKNKSITSLELDYNKIKDEGSAWCKSQSFIVASGLIALAEAVYYHRNLEVLSLAGNQIGSFVSLFRQIPVEKE